jgi:hypothetical protein
MSQSNSSFEKTTKTKPSKSITEQYKGKTWQRTNDKRKLNEGN